jgi:hypothetical protein
MCPQGFNSRRKRRSLKLMHKFTMEEGVKGMLSVKSRNISFWFINAPKSICWEIVGTVRKNVTNLQCFLARSKILRDCLSLVSVSDSSLGYISICPRQRWLPTNFNRKTPITILKSPRRFPHRALNHQCLV